MMKLECEEFITLTLSSQPHSKIYGKIDTDPSKYG